jgi:hypothetical protein
MVRDPDARMTIVMRFISGVLQNLIFLFLKLGKQGRHCTGECTTCQAIQCRGTFKGAIEDSRPSQLLRFTRSRGKPCLEVTMHYFSGRVARHLARRQKERDIGVCIWPSDAWTNWKVRLLEERAFLRHDHGMGALAPFCIGKADEAPELDFRASRPNRVRTSQISAR